MRRLALGLLVLLIAVPLLLLTVFGVATRTDWGRERLRGLALDAVRGAVQGRIEVGRVDGALPGEVVLHDVLIEEHNGAPFFRARRIATRVDWRALLQRRIALHDVMLTQPVLHLSQDREGSWNWERIFPAGEGPADTTAGFGDWIRLRDVRMQDGAVTIRRPWTPDVMAPATPTEIAALADSALVRVERVAGGFEQVTTLEQVDGVLSDAIVAERGNDAMRFEVDSLRAMVHAFRSPPLDLRRLTGTITLEGGTTRLDPVTVVLPGSQLQGVVSIDDATGDIEGTLRAPRLAFADLRTLYPPLPTEGGGALDLVFALRDSLPSEYRVTNGRLRTGETAIAGDFAIQLTDAGVAHLATDLEVTRLTSTLVEQLVPGLVVTPRGEISGHVEATGPLERLVVDADTRMTVAGYPSFALAARGGVGVLDSAFETRALAFRVRHLPVAVTAAFDVAPPVGGLLDITGTVSGRSDAAMRGNATVMHLLDGAVSRARLEGRVALNAGNRMDVVAELDELALATVAAMSDSLELQGAVSGEVRVTGVPTDLYAVLDLTLPRDGRVTGSIAWQQPSGDSARYALDLSLTEVAPMAILPAVPDLMVGGRVELRGRGLEPASMDAVARARLDVITWDSTDVRDVVFDATARGGILQVDTLSGSTAFAQAQARGRFGLAPSATGELAWQLNVNDLGGLQRWIATGDTGSVTVRPGVQQRLARARGIADSALRAQREQENPAAALAGLRVDSVPRLARATATPVPAIRRDSTGGAFTVTGTLEGHVEAARLDGTLQTEGLAWNGNLLGAGTVRGSWHGLFTDADTLQITAGVDSLQAAGFAFDSTRVRGRWARATGEGELVLGVFPGDSAFYRMESDFRVRADEREIRLRDVELRMDATTWRTVHPSTLSWREEGLRVDSLDLRSAGDSARILVHGELPARDPGRLDVRLDAVRLAPWLSIVQSDLAVDGALTAAVSVDGTAALPVIRGSASLDSVLWDGVSFPNLDARLDYTNEKMRVAVEARREVGGTLALVTGTVPIDLRLVDSIPARLPPDGVLDLRIAGDSIPLGPLESLTDAVDEVMGRARARLAVAGTWEAPRLSGDMTVDLDRVRVLATGARFRDTHVAMRFLGDTLTIDTAVARSVGGTDDAGTVRAEGTLIFRSLTTPEFDLALVAAGAQVLDDPRGALVANADLRVLGPLDTLFVLGNVQVRRGVVYIPDPESFDVIDTEDPAIFAVADTGLTQALGIEPVSRVLEQMSMDVNVTVDRGVFARSSDANVEVYGDVRVRLEPSVTNYLVTGVLNADRGDYRIYGKRFLVTRGSVRFIGNEELNPSLQVVATYVVQQAGRAPLDIRVLIGGTLEQPTVSLESDAQPALSQSDLIAFLAFGRNTSSLLEFAGSGLEAGGSGGSTLAGSVAALATRQLASIGLGALVEELRGDLASVTGADVLHITPAQLPAEVTLGGLQTVLRGTEIEVGRYLNERTFLLGRVRTSLALPGASIEHRLQDGVQLRASLETRIQGTPPSLSRGVSPRTLQVFGAVLLWTRSW